MIYAYSLPKRANFLSYMVLFVCFFSFIPRSTAQETVVMYSKDLQDTYIADNSKTFYDRDLNDIIEKMAEGNRQSKSDIEFHMKYSYQVKIEKNGHTLNLLVFLKDLNLSGDTRYRNFDISNTVFPYQVSGNLKLYKGSTNVKTYEIPRTIINFKQPIFTTTYIDTTDSKFTISFTDIRFTYGGNNKNSFSRLTQNIDNYYRSSQEINNRMKEAENLDFSQLDKLGDFQRWLKKNIDYSNSVEDEDFMKVLNISSSNDPSGFLNTNNKFEQVCKNQLNTVESYIRIWHELYYNEGIKFLEKGNTSDAENNFIKSIEKKQSYAPPYSELAEIYYNRRDTRKAVDILKDLQANTDEIDQSTSDKAEKISENIYNQYIGTVNQHLGDAQYADAISMAETTYDLCRSLEFMREDERLTLAYFEAANGLYEQQIEKLNKALESKNFKQAETEVQNARMLQSRYSQYVPREHILLPYLEKIFKGYFDFGEAYRLSGDFEKAIVQYENAQRFCNAEPKIECTTQLVQNMLLARNNLYIDYIDKAENDYRALNLQQADNWLDKAEAYSKSHNLSESSRFTPLRNSVKYAYYLDFINKGQQNADDNNFSEALNFYDLAVQLEQKYSFAKDYSLPNRIRLAAKGKINLMAIAGTLEVDKNNVPSAKQYLNTAVETARKYNLSDDTECKNQIDGLNQDIFNRECKNLTIEYRNQCSIAEQLINDKKYIEASKELDKAIKIPLKKLECSISTASMENKRDSIKEAVAYQQLMNETYKEISNGNYLRSINVYTTATQHYNDNNIKQFRLVHESVDDFIIGTNNETYMQFCIQYYADIPQFDFALKILKALNPQKETKLNTKAIQEYLGMKLAYSDYEKNPKSRANDWVYQYTEHNKGYVYLKRSYKKYFRKQKYWLF